MKNSEIKSIIDQEIAARPFCTEGRNYIKFCFPACSGNKVVVQPRHYIYEVSCVHPNGGWWSADVGYCHTFYGIEGEASIRRKVAAYLDDLIARGYGAKEIA